MSATIENLLAAQQRIDFTARTCAYYGCEDEHYTENYPAVKIE